jgi:hypothetical protein
MFDSINKKQCPFCKEQFCKEQLVDDCGLFFCREHIKAWYNQSLTFCEGFRVFINDDPYVALVGNYLKPDQLLIDMLADNGDDKEEWIPMFDVFQYTYSDLVERIKTLLVFL